MPSAPMRVIERLQQAVKPQGLLGVMSSGRGSVTNNLTGQRELYRGSKAALNMFMRSFAARPSSASHPLVVMAPGWIRTELGGADAPLTIEETIPRPVNVLLDKRQRPGLEYLDYRGPYRALGDPCRNNHHMAARKLTPPGAACYRPYSAALSLYSRFIVQKM